MQLLLDFLQQARDALLGIQFLLLLQAVHLVLLHILDGQVEQFLFVAPLGDGEGHVLQFHVQFEGYDDFARLALVAFAHLDDAQLEQFLLGFLKTFLVLEGEGLVDGTVRDVQVVDESRLFIGIFFDGEDVDVVEYVAHHFRA